MKIFDFEDLFSFDFGAKRNKTVYPDVGSDREFGIRIRTPDHEEHDVRLGVSLGAFVMNKKYQLLMTRDGKTLFKSNRMLNMFVNQDGKDPKPTQLRDGTTPEVQFIDRETHLLPDTEYVYIMRDFDGGNPMHVAYYGTDPEGAEQYGDGILHELDGRPGIWYPLD